MADRGAQLTMRAAVFRCGAFAFDLSRPLVMGVLNVTPDSFSDGGRFADREQALSHARRMRDDGADIVDIGGESSRPGAEPVGAGRRARARASRSSKRSRPKAFPSAWIRASPR